MSVESEEGMNGCGRARMVVGTRVMSVRAMSFIFIGWTIDFEFQLRCESIFSLYG